MVKGYPIFLWVILLPLRLMAQEDDPDQFGRRYETQVNDPVALAQQLCRGFSTDFDKARAIFSWLAHHIHYDLREARANRPIQIAYTSPEDLEQKLQAIRYQRMEKALTLRRGVCNHYASLYQTMCQAVGLRAGEIEGYVPRSPGDINTLPAGSNHVWNWVSIEGRKVLVDVTYAAGKADPHGASFRMHYEPAWFDVPPDILIRTHFPTSQEEQFLLQGVSAQDFARQPFFYPSSVRVGVTGHDPENGVVWVGEDPVYIDLAFRQKPEEVYVIIDNVAQELDTHWAGNRVSLRIPRDLLRYREYLDIGMALADGTLGYLMSWRVKHF